MPSRQLLHKIRDLVTSKQLEGFSLGEESMGYDVSLSPDNVTALTEGDAQEIKELLHSWAYDHASEIGWGLYYLYLDAELSLKIRCAGILEDEICVPLAHWVKRILNEVVPHATPDEAEDCRIVLQIDYRGDRTKTENLKEFNLVVFDSEDSEIKISELSRERIHGDLVKSVEEACTQTWGEGWTGFTFRTDDLSASQSSARALFENRDDFNLSGYFEAH